MPTARGVPGMRPRHCYPGRPWLATGSARHRSGVRGQDHDRSDRGQRPPGAPLTSRRRRRPPPTWATSRPPSNNRWHRTSRLSLFPRRRHRPTPSGHRPPRSSRRVSRPTSSPARNGAPTNRCAAETGRSTQPIRAAVVHHTAESNDYQPQDSAAIVQSIYAYHTQMLGWCDIAYNALVDKYGQVFEGRAGALTGRAGRPHRRLQPRHWGVAMIGNFDDVPPTPIQLRTVGRLLGWRLGLDRVNPKGTVTLTSAGGPDTNFPSMPRDAADHLQPPRRRRHRLPGQCRLRAAWTKSATSQHVSTARPDPKTWRWRCRAARSTTDGRRWAP